jgi:hypothetical protein
MSFQYDVVKIQTLLHLFEPRYKTRNDSHGLIGNLGSTPIDHRRLLADLDRRITTNSAALAEKSTAELGNSNLCNNQPHPVLLIMRMCLSVARCQSQNSAML